MIYIHFMKFIKSFKLNIAAKLLIGFIMLVVVFIISDWYIINSIRSYLLNQSGKILSEKARNASLQIDSFFSGFWDHAEGISSFYKEPLDDDSRLQIINSAKFVIATEKYFKKIVILKPNGREIVKVDRDGLTPDNALSFEITSDSFELARNGKQTISKIFYTEEEPGPNVNMYSPVLEGTTVVAILKMQINLDQLWDVLSKVTLGETGYAYIVDSDGRLIAHPNQQLVRDNQILTSRPIINTAIKNTPLPIWPEGYDYNNENNIPVVAQIEKVSKIGWTTVFEQSEEEAYAYTRFIRRFFLISYSFTGLVLLIISFLLSNDLVHSIHVLIQGAKKFEKEELKTRIDIASGDEFEELGNVLNSMAEKLDKTFHALDEQKRRSVKTAELLLRRDLDLRDINEELEQEKDKIAAERNKFMVVLSGITDAVISLDLRQYIATFNASAEKITGYKAVDVVGKPVSSVLHLFDKDHEVKTDEYCPSDSDGGVVFRGKYLKLAGNNKQSFVNLVVGKIPGGERINLGGIISIHDLTEEQRLEEMKLDFVSMAAHELRTPLTSIRGYLSLFFDEFLNELSEKQKLLLRRVDISAKQLNSLVENLLSVSRIEKGAFAINPKPVDWLNLVKTIVEELTSRANDKHITLSLQNPGVPVSVMADELRIGEVVTNLVVNAINYTGEGGHVTVSIEVKDDVVITHVQDTGEGIPKEAISRLFTKFFRGSTTLVQGAKGTGLGLYISKAIVTIHKGTISVESELGKGSTFTFTLPKVPSA